MTEMEHEKTSKEIREVAEMPIDLPYLSPEVKEELERRILEYEREYEQAVFERRDALIPRVSATDYIIGGVISLLLTIYLAASLLM